MRTQPLELARIPCDNPPGHVAEATSILFANQETRYDSCTDRLWPPLAGSDPCPGSTRTAATHQALFASAAAIIARPEIPPAAGAARSEAGRCGAAVQARETAAGRAEREG